MPDFNELVKNLYTSKNRELTQEKLDYIKKTYTGKEEDFVKNFYATVGEELPQEKLDYISKTYLSKKTPSTTPDVSSFNEKYETSYTPKEFGVGKTAKLDKPAKEPVAPATSFAPTKIDPYNTIKTKDVVDINAEKAPKTMAQMDKEHEATMNERRIGTLTQRNLDENIEYQNLLVKKQAKELGYTDDKTLNGTTAVQKLANDREEGWKEDYLEPEELAQVRAFEDYQTFKGQGKEKESNEALQKYLNSRSEYRKKIDNDIVDLKGELFSAKGDDAVLIKATIDELEAKKLPFYDPKKQMESFLTENEPEVAAVSRPTETAQEKLKKYILAQDNLVHNLRNRLGLTDKNHSFQRFTEEWKVLGEDKRQRDDLEFLHSQELKLKNAVQILELNRTPLDKDSAWGVFAKEYVGGLIPQVKGFSGTDNTIAANIGNIVQDADITYAANEKQVQTAKFANNQYQFGSAKWIAQNVAPTLAVMTEMIPAAVLTEGIGSIGYLSRLSRPLKILAERGSLGKAGGTFFKAIQANKYGRGLLKAAASGVNYGIESQAVTTLAPQLKDEMGFSNGLFAGTVGSVAGQLAGKVMETSLKSIATLFGNKAPQAIAAIEKYGSVIAKAKEFSNTVAGETTEEYGEQLMSIYKESDNYKNFIYNLKKHYETTDALEEFATILIMSVGAPAGSTLGRSLFDASKKAYNNLSRKERETASRMADEIHSEVNMAMDDAANQTIRDENIQVPTRSVEEQDNAILQKQKDLKLPTSPEVVLSDISQAAMAKMENGEALTIEELKELSNELYQRYNGISATKDQDNRQFTTEQINETLAKLENNITLLENSKNKLEESGETSIVINPKETVTQEAKPVTSTPNTKFYQGVDFRAQTGLPNGDYTEEQVKAAREAKLKKEGVPPAELEQLNAEQEIIPTTEAPAAPISGVSGEVQESGDVTTAETSERVVYDREPTANDGVYKILGDFNNIIYRVNPATGRIQEFSDGLWSNTASNAIARGTARKQGFQKIKDPSKVEQPTTKQNEKDSTEQIANEADRQVVLEGVRETGNENEIGKDSEQLREEEVVSKTLSEQIADLRAEEQAELKEKLPNAEYKADGKIDVDKLSQTDAITYGGIYIKYDKLITPLIREQKAEQKAAEVAPKEGDTSTTKSFTGATQKMVFTDGEWQLKVGNITTKVAKSVQQEAQDTFNEENKIQTTNNLKDGKDQNKNEGRGNEPIEANGQEVRNNGRDAIGERGRTESEKNASRAEAKEKIISKINNVSLKIANQYNKIAGLAKIVAHKFKNSDKEEQSRAGKAYEKLQDPTSPTYKETKLEKGVFEGYKAKYPELIKKYDIKNYKELVEKSYGELAKEVEAQFNLLPIKVDFHTGDKNYENSAEMLDDVHNFGHLWVFKGGDDHPITGSKTIDKNGLTINDKFRAVHDYFGHSINGYEFGKNGEENAWIEHSKMFSPLAQLALSSETRGQNSVVNYSGINDAALEKMKRAAAYLKKGLAENNAEMIADSKKLLEEANNEFQFAEQKAVILPEEYTNASQYFKEQAPVIETPVIEVPKLEIPIVEETVTETPAIEEEEEQYEPITVSDTSHDTFTKDNAVDYEEGEREGDNGRSYPYLASVTVELVDDNSGDTLGTISKLKSEDGEITWNAENNDGDLVAEEASSKAEAQQALVDNYNKQKLKEFNKEKAKAAKQKIKEAEKAKNKAQKIADKEQKALEKIKEKEARRKKLEDLARESGLDISEDDESPVFSVELNENLAEDLQDEVKTIVEEAISNPEFATSETVNVESELPEGIPMQQIVVDENDTRPEAQMMAQLSIPLEFIFGKSVGVGMSDTLTTGERTVPVMDTKTGEIADKKVREEGGIGYPFKSLIDLINGKLAEGKKAMGWAGVALGASSAMVNAAGKASKITGKELKAHYFKSLELTAEQKKRIEDAIPDKKEYGIVIIYKMGADGIKSNEAYAREAFRLIDVTLSAAEKEDFFKKVKERLAKIAWEDKDVYLDSIKAAKSFLELENILHGENSKMPLLVKTDIINKGILSSEKTESKEDKNPVGFLLKSKGITVESVAANIAEPVMEGITTGQPMLAIAIDPDSTPFEDITRNRHKNYPFGVEGFPIGLFQSTASFHNLAPDMMDVFIKSATTQIQEVKNKKGAKVSLEFEKTGKKKDKIITVYEKVKTKEGVVKVAIKDKDGNIIKAKTEEEIWVKLKELGYTPRISISQNLEGNFIAEEGSGTEKTLILDSKGKAITAKTMELLYAKLKKAGVKLDKEFQATRYSQKINGGTFITLLKKAQQALTEIYKNPKLTAQEKLVKHLSKAFPSIVVEMTLSEYNKLQEGFIEKKLFTKSGKSYGVVKDGRVYLNPTYLNNNTPIHEFGHIWNAVAREARPELYKKGADLVKDTKYTQNIINSPSYQKIIKQLFGDKAIVKNKATGKYEINSKSENFDKINDYVIDEALARAIGDKGELFVNEVQKRKSFQDWMNLLFDVVKQIAGFPTIGSQEFQDLTIDQFVNAAVKELLGGKQISDITSDNLANLSKESAYAKFSVTDKEKEFRKNALAQGYTNKEIDAILKKAKKPSVAPESKPTENESPTATTEQAEFIPDAKDIAAFSKILGTKSGAIRNKNIAEAVKVNPKIQEIMDNFEELKKQLMASVELTEDCSW